METRPTGDRNPVARIEDWPVAGDPISKLSLHVHVDPVAREKVEDILEALLVVKDGPALTMTELDARVAIIGRILGLRAYATSGKCRFDPLETFADAVFHSI